MRTVKLSDYASDYNMDLGVDCVWENADISVFNQDGQRLKFRYQNCPDYSVESIRYGSKPFRDSIMIRMSSPENASESLNYFMSDRPNFYITKLGPDTIEDYLKRKVRDQKSLQSGICTTTMISQNVWTISYAPKKDEWEELKKYQNTQVVSSVDDLLRSMVAREREVCGYHRDWRYIIADRIVFKVPTPAHHTIIDVESIVFTAAG